MAEKRTAARDASREAAPSENTSAAIFAIASRIGNCIACGQHIRLTAGVTTCPTCAAWRRWYSAHRIASRYLREIPR